MGIILYEIVRFLYFITLAWNCLFTPTLGVLGAYFPQMTSSIILTSKRHLLARKHVVWAIKHKNRFNGSTWARAREKKTGQDSQKCHKGLYFTYFGRSPHWTDLHRNLYSSCRPRHNHMCKVSNWIFQGLRFYEQYNLVATKTVISLAGVVTAGLVESNGSLPPGLWLMSPAGWLPRNRDQLCAQRPTLVI